ncbi:hypothetical protein BSR28_06965 [Boudabousia liubingyangii]|uniref:DUF262 domain-containing protein n=1 Tax=Boudabousia liubingyangii TaxID=1921764 RepID=UPI00093BDE91|nr:DUF262 domain-containing protein [Boudabousia liubingyangii]OKL46275.1 hypothetical protein BSR28_06965 [Boudabousia liubingyangii]
MNDGSFRVYSTSLVDLLNTKSVITIPLFQRDFVWGEDTSPLAIDLATTIINYKNAKNSKTHLLGTLLFADYGEWTEVIDGQQRLLTLMILLSTLTGLALNDPPADQSPNPHPFLHARFHHLLLSFNEAYRWKLIDQNSPTFLMEFFDNVTNISSQVRFKDPQNSRESNIISVYKKIYALIRADMQKKIKNDSNPAAYGAYFNRWYEVLNEMVFFSIIEIKPEAVHETFIKLNRARQELSDEDIIKSWLFDVARRRHKNHIKPPWPVSEEKSDSTAKKWAEYELYREKRIKSYQSIHSKFSTHRVPSFFRISGRHFRHESERVLATLVSLETPSYIRKKQELLDFLDVSNTTNSNKNTNEVDAILETFGNALSSLEWEEQIKKQCQTDEVKHLGYLELLSAILSSDLFIMATTEVSNRSAIFDDNFHARIDANSLLRVLVYKLHLRSIKNISLNDHQLTGITALIVCYLQLSLAPLYPFPNGVDKLSKISSNLLAALTAYANNLSDFEIQTFLKIFKRLSALPEITFKLHRFANLFSWGLHRAIFVENKGLDTVNGAQDGFKNALLKAAVILNTPRNNSPKKTTSSSGGKIRDYLTDQADLPNLAEEEVLDYFLKIGRKSFDPISNNTKDLIDEYSLKNMNILLSIFEQALKELEES